MPLSASCLWADIDEVKAWLKMATTEDQFDGPLTQIAESVTQDLERATGRVFVARAIADVIDGDGSSRVWLTYFPAATLTLTVAGTALTVTTDYVLDAANGLVRRVGGYLFPRGVANVSAAYTAGWARALLPASITMLGQEMVSLRFEEWRASVIAATSINLGPANMVIKPGWPYQILEKMNQLRREGRP